MHENKSKKTSQLIVGFQCSSDTKIMQPAWRKIQIIIHIKHRQKKIAQNFASQFSNKQNDKVGISREPGSA